MLIGLIPGAMKPYHAGHHFLTSVASAACDKVIIFTTVKSRGPIDGMAMWQIWNDIIIPLLPANVSVEFVGSPVSAVYDILEQEQLHPSENEYKLYSGTEDLARFSSEYVNKKFPLVADRFENVAETTSSDFLRGVGSSPMVKGAWIRKALAAGDVEKFSAMMPEFLQSRAEDIFNMLK